MADSPKSIARRKWGRFLPHQRANVDQVPLPFVNDMEAVSYTHLTLPTILLV